jgi:hypothetical protein
VSEYSGSWCIGVPVHISPSAKHVSGVGGAGVPAGSPSFVRRYTQSSAVQTYAPALV